MQIDLGNGVGPNYTAVVAVAFGNKTLAGHGEASLGYPGTGALSITSGNAAGVWTINSRNNLAPAGTFGGAAPAYGSGPYVLTVADGGSFTAQITVSIIPNVYHIASVTSGTNADTPSVFQLNTVMTLAGLTLPTSIYLRDGIYYHTNQRWLVQRAGAYLGAGRLSIRSENIGGTTNASLRVGSVGGAATIGYIELNGFAFVAYNADFSYLNFGSLRTTVGVARGGLNATGGADSITADRCYFYSEPGAVGYSSIIGDGFLAAGGVSYSVTNSIFQGLTVGIVVTGTSATANPVVTSNVFFEIWEDATDFIDCSAATWSWNCCYNARDDGGHGDWLQCENLGTAAGVYTGFTVIGNAMWRGNESNALSAANYDKQGMFQADVAAGVSFTGTVIAGNFYLGSYSNAFVNVAQNRATVKWNTACQDQTGPTDQTPLVSFANNTNGGYALYNEYMGPLVTGTGLTSAAGNVQLTTPFTDYPFAFTGPVYGQNLTTLAQVVAAFAMRTGGTLDHTSTGFTYNCGAIGTGYVDFTNMTTSFPL